VFGSLNMSVRELRSEMGLNQSELAGLVGIGTRAIQSYEQGWRQPSEIVERMLLLLLIAHRKGVELPTLRCWEQRECPPRVCEKCIAYKTCQGHLCWFLTGTLCEGQRKKTWAEKLGVCLECGFMQELLNPVMVATESTITQR